MAVETVSSFFGILLLSAIALALVSLFVPAIRSTIAPTADQTAAMVAVGATAGSLYFSEIADYVPCELCWFQRIAMYPLALILTVAALRRDRAPLTYVRILAGLGAMVSAYHIQLQWFPEQGSMCEASNPCSGRWVEAFGWMTIPQMAGGSFLLIIVLTTLSINATATPSPVPTDAEPGGPVSIPPVPQELP